MTEILLTAFSIVVASLVWARFAFFEFQSKKEKTVSRIYDPLVTVHIVGSFYYLLTADEPRFQVFLIALFLIVSGEFLFIFSLMTAKKLNFASSEQHFTLLDTGPFQIVRHPLYLSYTLIWLATPLVFNSLMLWITLGSLIAFYTFSAKREEEAILSSEYSREYSNYKNRVGMFLPRISQWKSWILKLLRVKKS